MTSDAKIGLLLGLVFIFVIAFIINGLPNLKSPQSTQAEVTTNMVSFPEENVGIGGAAQAQADHDWNTLVDDQPPAETEETVADQVTPSTGTLATQSEPAGNQDVRFEAMLPGNEGPAPHSENPLTRIGNVLERLTMGQQTAREPGVSTVNMDVPSATTDTPVATERQPASRSVDTVMRTMEQPRPSASTQTRAPTTPIKPLKIYTVQDGESLSTVAKNVYGSEEGNRIVNVNRIYEANKDVLKSVHEVVAGQKLVIPALPPQTANPNNPSDVLKGELFEKVQTLAKRPPAQTIPTSEFRWYTVQDGDNLWKIASSQLGAGARYEEIAKLNGDLLKDAAKVDPGMKIRLPVK